MVSDDSLSTQYVLILEDNADLRQMLIEILEIEGYRVLSAGGGAEAWTIMLAQPRQPMLIISDLIMDKVDGCEFLIQLRANPQYRTVPFVMLTVAAESQIPCWNLHTEHDYFVRKPFTVADLLRVVRTILKTGQTL